MSDGAAAWIPASDPRMPERLRQLTRPTVRGVAYAGRPDHLWEGVRVAVVGSRTARSDSIAIARRIAGDLAAAGITIVSGLARGVDSAAHEAALDSGGATIAVLGSGLGFTYPVRNRPLAARISGTQRVGTGIRAGRSPDARGVVISAYGVGAEPALPHRFPERNRIIAALSDYLVVIQAERRSGSMSTAQVALELGVPIGIGPIDAGSSAFQGTLDLVRDGADTVVDGRSVAHRLELHGVVPVGFAASIEAGARIDAARNLVAADPDLVAGARRARLLEHPVGSLLDVPRSEEDVAALAGLELRAVRRMLVELEDDGLAQLTSDGLWIEAGLC